ncbi:MAG: hypothetical protein FJW20_15240 [Acidimicrobiia bacterium]|nr:hypothetical protein [Acidimicrobiia bacterium]
MAEFRVNWISLGFGWAGLATAKPFLFVFLRLNRAGAGDYTRDREQWQKDLTIDQILGSIRQRRPSDQPRRWRASKR